MFRKLLSKAWSSHKQGHPTMPVLRSGETSLMIVGQISGHSDVLSMKWCLSNLLSLPQIWRDYIEELSAGSILKYHQGIVEVLPRWLINAYRPNPHRDQQLRNYYVKRLLQLRLHLPSTNRMVKLRLVPTDFSKQSNVLEILGWSQLDSPHLTIHLQSTLEKQKRLFLKVNSHNSSSLTSRRTIWMTKRTCTLTSTKHMTHLSQLRSKWLSLASDTNVQQVWTDTRALTTMHPREVCREGSTRSEFSGIRLLIRFVFNYHLTEGRQLRLIEPTGK